MGGQTPPPNRIEQAHAGSRSNRDLLRIDQTLAALPMPAYFCDADGRITYCNAHASRLWGRAPKLNHDADRFCGALRTYTTSGSPLPRDQSPTAEALQQGRAQQREVLIQRTDGCRVAVLATAGPIYDDAGRLLGASTFLAESSPSTADAKSHDESNARFRAIVDSSSVLICCFQSDGRLTFANESYCAFFGKTRNELVGRSLRSLAPKEDRPFIEEMFAALSPDMTPFTQERRMLLPTGDVRWQQWTVRVVRALDGSFQEYHAIGRDVTERRRAQDDLSEAQRFSLRLTDVLPAVLYVHDLKQQRNVYVNRRAEPTLGYSAEQFEAQLALGMDKVMHPEDFPRFASYMERVVELPDGEVAEFQYRMRHADGSWRWFQSRDAPFARNADGSVCQIIGTATDVTERMQAEQALEKSHEELRAFFSQTINGCFFMILDEPVRWDDATDKEAVLDYVLDHERTTEINDAMLALYGATREQMLQRTPGEIFQHNRAEGRKLWRQVYDAGKLRLESDERKHDGTQIWIEGEYIVLYDTDGRITGHFGIQRDITDRKQSEEDLRLFRSLIERSNDGIEVADPETGRFIDVNEQACLSHGYTRDEYLQLSVVDINPGLGQRPWAELSEEFRRLGSFVTGSHHRRKDGSLFPVEVSVSYIRLQREYFLAVVRDVTEREQAEAELREQRTLLQTLIENTPAAVAMFDREMRYLAWSERWLVDYRLEAREILGESHYDVFPEVGDDWKAVHQRCLAGATESCDDDPFPRADGSLDYVRWVVSPWREVGGDVGGVIMFTEVTTERVRAEELIRSNVEVLAAITNVQRQFLVDDMPGRSFDSMLALLLKATASEYGFIGEVRRSSSGMPYLKTHAITNIAWNEQSRAFYDQHFETGLEFHNLDSLFGAVITSGATVIANDPASDPRRCGLPPDHPALRAFLGIPLFHGEQLIGMVGLANRPGGYDEETIKNIDAVLATCARMVQAFRVDCERKQAEAAVRDNEQRLSAIAATMPQALYVFDILEQKSIYINREAEKELGYSQEEMERIGPEFMNELLHPDDLRRMPKLLSRWDTVSDGEILEVEYRMRHASGEWRWFIGRDAVYQRTEDGRVRQIIGTAQDITERKRAEEERRRLESQVQHAQKLESLGVLAGGIAHDFNNILTVIFGYANVVSSQLPETSPSSPMLREIEKAAERAADLTRQMLAYAGKGEFVIQPVRLDELVQEMTSLLHTVVSKKASVELSLQPATINADATQVRQVVMNLVTNASDALQDSEGVICIRTGIKQVDASQLISCYTSEELPAGDYAYFQAEDTGCGMDEETLESIFDPFFTTKFAGRGLGLAAVLGIIRGHRGTIKVTSTRGQGSTFEVLIPCAEATAMATGGTSNEPPPKGRGAVLVVDDEPTVRLLAQNVLEDAGFRVLLAEDGRQALDVLETHGQAIVVMLLDLIMPRMDGPEVLRQLQIRAPGLPVVLMSGYGEQELATRLAESRANGFIQKPFRARELVEKVCRLLPAASRGSVKKK